MRRFSYLAMGMLWLLLGASAHAATQPEESPTVVRGAVTVSAKEAKALFDQGVPFVDVRRDSDFEAGRIPGAVHLEINEAFNEATLLEVAAKSDKLVVYCNGPKCLRSSAACEQAVGWGFEHVLYFRDGFPTWKASGYPIE
ncbi:MAG: rhodanese-like domain-containing protein [Gammaproteobacteria bacterium]|nr:rhodanese-like domain-containing protein [Gammaproteobacteria bacterium]